MAFRDVDELAYEICCSPDEEDSMLLCERCERGYHMACLSPPLSALPKEEWLCENCGRCLLLALSHDELGVIFDGLADPLQPVVAVALSSTCEGLRTPLRAALEVLKQRYAEAQLLCKKVHAGFDEEDMRRPMTCTILRDAEHMQCKDGGLTAADATTLGMILRTNGLPKLRFLILDSEYARGTAPDFGEAGLQMLCQGIGRGTAPSLTTLDLTNNQLGPASPETLAAALSRGAMPKLVSLFLGENPIGNQGAAALAAPLRKLPALEKLYLFECEIGDEGVASLFADLGKDDFKKLEQLNLNNENKITDIGCATLVKAVDGGRLPSLERLYLGANPATDAALQAVADALARAKARRRS